MDYQPFNSLFFYLSDWLKTIYGGDYDGFMKMIKGKTEIEMKMMISRRETMMNMSAIFHVICGSWFFSPKNRLTKQQAEGRKLMKVKNEHMEIFLKLIDLGCDVNIRDVAGFTPFHHCCCVFATEETLEMAEMLLKKGADINAKSRFGNTALQEATDAHRYDLVKFLLENGADPYIVDNDGNSARMIASGQSFNPKIREIFSKFEREKARQERKVNGNPWKCGYCGKDDRANKKCTGCYHIWYCNRKCQLNHRNDHKKVCEV